MLLCVSYAQAKKQPEQLADRERQLLDLEHGGLQTTQFSRRSPCIQLGRLQDGPLRQHAAWRGCSRAAEGQPRQYLQVKTPFSSLQVWRQAPNSSWTLSSSWHLFKITLIFKYAQIITPPGRYLHLCIFSRGSLWRERRRAFSSTRPSGTTGGVRYSARGLFTTGTGPRTGPSSTSSATSSRRSI